MFISVDDNDKVQSAAYITQGQKPYTYNDITKYFKCGEDYKEYVKGLYPDAESYKRDMLIAYQEKLAAYCFAKKKIMLEHPEYTDILEFLKEELNENGFHEKSVLRDKLNQYMSDFIAENNDEKNEMANRYERFYWTNTDDISNEMGKTIKVDENNFPTINEYETLLSYLSVNVKEQPKFNTKKYFTANTSNAIELDTYITNPDSRHYGLARKLVYHGIKKHMEKFFENPENDEIFLCSTLHRDNVSSKYVSEFFGLKDSLYVNRRQGRDREVHICRISRDNAKLYLNRMNDKLAVLYGYNPEGRKIATSTEYTIVYEQLNYEIKEVLRLTKANLRHPKRIFKKGTIKGTKSKIQKIRALEKRLTAIERGELTHGGER